MPQPLAKAPSDVAKTLAQALQFHQQGRLPEAERLYAEILAARPDHYRCLADDGADQARQRRAGRRLAAHLGRDAGPQAVAADSVELRHHPQCARTPSGSGRELRRRAQAEIEIRRGAQQSRRRARRRLAATRRRWRSLPQGARHQPELCRSALQQRLVAAHARPLRGGAEKLRARAGAAAELCQGAQQPRRRAGSAEQARSRALAAYERALAINPAFCRGAAQSNRVLCSLDRFDEALASFAQALALNPERCRRPTSTADASISISTATTMRSRISKKRWRSSRTFAEARFAACFAELPILYADEAEIARRRAAYEQSLRTLSDDVAAGRVPGDLIKALTVKQPFLLAYQGSKRP